MRDLISALRDRNRQVDAPVPLAPRWASTGLGGLLTPSGTEAQIRALGTNGTLFAIIDGFVSAVAAVTWHMHRTTTPTGNPVAPEKEDRPAIQHPALDLWNRPNRFYSRTRLVKIFQQHKELVGEGILVVAKIGTLPFELWPVRPDRMEAVTHPTRYLTGWIYHSPDGERIPLDVDQVIHVVQTPCPWDSYRGFGAAQTVVRDVYGDTAAAEWQANFFRNSARPDGVIEVPAALSDVEFREFRDRWRDAHQGVGNAHRVAVLEHGAAWKPTSYSAHDMEFTALRAASHEAIRGAFRMPRTILGEGETLNRATAEAQLFMFSSGLVVPRLADIRDDGLNFGLLPMYGPTGVGVEFDFVNPTPEDAEAADRARTSQAAAFEIYVRAGVDPVDAARVCGLPPLRVTRPEPAPAPAPPGEPAAPAGVHRPVVRLSFGRAPHRALPQAAADGEEEAEPELAGVLGDLKEALTRLELDWEEIDAAWVDDLAGQVEEAVDNGDPSALASLSVGTEEAAGLLRRSLGRMAATAARRAARECAAQGVEIDPPEVDEEVTARLGVPDLRDFGLELVEIARVTAELIASGLTAAAAREALRHWTPGAKGQGRKIAGKVKKFLKNLGGATRHTMLGGALHRATNLARLAVFAAALKARRGGELRASERNDKNTCPPCKDIDTHVFPTVGAADAAYGTGGYILCEGGERCRGTLTVRWPKE